MFTASIAFFGRYRPAYFEGETALAAVTLARNAVAASEHGDKLCSWLATALGEVTRSASCSGFSIEHGTLCVTLRQGPHDRFLDSVTASLPPCPGLNYSGAANMTESSR